MSLRETLGAYWRRRPVRAACAALVLLAAVYLQYRLANIPLPAEIAKGKSEFTPVTASFDLNHELIVDNPAGERGLLLVDEGQPQLTVDAHFESARLGEDILELLRRERPPKPLPPSGPVEISYTTAGDAGEVEEEPRPGRVAAAPADSGGEPCRTFVRVAVAEGAGQPGELHLFQLKAPNADQYRYFEIKATGADLLVELLTRNRAGGAPDDSCRKTLSVGDWRRSLSSPVPLHIVVPGGASFRFTFTPLKGEPPWAGQGGSHEPFELGSARLTARAVRVAARDATPASAPFFKAESVGGPPLLLRQLLVGREELQLDFAGKAMVHTKGEPARTFDALKFAGENRLLAGLLLMLDAALLEWIRRAVFK